MYDEISIKIIAKSWAHLVLLVATVLAGILLPIVATMNYETRAEAMTSAETNDGAHDGSLLDEVGVFLDKLQRAQKAHNLTVSSASDMKSVVDELEASEIALNETERANADSAYGVDDSVSVDVSKNPSAAEKIDDAYVPLSASATGAPRSKSLIVPAR